MRQLSYPCVISPAELLGSREIAFAPQHRSGFTQLLRLCTDFDFKVLQLQRKQLEPISAAPLTLVLASRHWETGLWHAATPDFSSLTALEKYVLKHQVDILHSHLFAEDVRLEDSYIQEY
jgi:hypothetical protein